MDETPVNVCARVLNKENIYMYIYMSQTLSLSLSLSLSPSLSLFLSLSLSLFLPRSLEEGKKAPPTIVVEANKK